jgi:hypothetical protein
MEGWAKIQNSFSNINLGAVGANLSTNLSNVGQNAGKLTKGFNSTLQATKGQILRVKCDCMLRDGYRAPWADQQRRHHRASSGYTLFRDRRDLVADA